MNPINWASFRDIQQPAGWFVFPHLLFMSVQTTWVVSVFVSQQREEILQSHVVVKV
jgi:hypothetical protein